MLLIKNKYVFPKSKFKDNERYIITTNQFTRNGLVLNNNSLKIFHPKYVNNIKTGEYFFPKKKYIQKKNFLMNINILKLLYILKY